MFVFDTLIAFMQIHPNLAYLILFLGSYFEIFIVTSFFIYGEIFFLSGAILAGTGILNIWLVSLCCILGGILGDSSSFFLGNKFGHHIIKYIFKEKNKYLSIQNYEKSAAFMHKNGLKGIFLARIAGPLSWITPFIAGTIKIKYPTFMKYNVPGVIVGIGQFLILGYIFGQSYAILLPQIKRDAFYLSLVIISVIILAISHRYKLHKRAFHYTIKSIKNAVKQKSEK